MNTIKKPDCTMTTERVNIVTSSTWECVAAADWSGGLPRGWTLLSYTGSPTPERTVRSRYTLAPRTPAYVWGIVLLLVLLAMVWLLPLRATGANP